jgi:hypothetical protein
MTPPELRPPRKNAWQGFALVGFAAGIVTVILVLLVWRRFGHQ